MRPPSIFTLAVILQFLGGSWLAVGVASSQGWYHLPEDGVWVSWSRVDSHSSRKDVEEQVGKINPGKEEGVILFVLNGLDRPIHNVTLILSSETSFRYRMLQTYAEDPPQGDYAFWRRIDANDNSSVGTFLQIPESAPERWEIHARLFFTDANGTQKTSLTTLKVETGTTTSVSNLLGNPWITGTTGALVGATICLMIRRIRK